MYRALKGYAVDDIALKHSSRTPLTLKVHAVIPTQYVEAVFPARGELGPKKKVTRSTAMACDQYLAVSQVSVIIGCKHTLTACLTYSAETHRLNTGIVKRFS